MIFSLVILSSVVTGVVCGFAFYNHLKGKYPNLHNPREDSTIAVWLGMLYALFPILGIAMAYFNTSRFRYGIFKLKP